MTWISVCLLTRLLQEEEKIMIPNVGGADRIVRVIAGLAIIAAGVYFQSWWGVVCLVPLATATLGWCPAYLPFGFSTCKGEPAR